MSTKQHESHTPASTWHKSSHSNEAGTCVEVREGPVTGVRDNQNPHLGALAFPAGAWNDFLRGVKASES